MDGISGTNDGGEGEKNGGRKNREQKKEEGKNLKKSPRKRAPRNSLTERIYAARHRGNSDMIGTPEYEQQPGHIQEQMLQAARIARIRNIRVVATALRLGVVIPRGEIALTNDEYNSIFGGLPAMAPNTNNASNSSNNQDEDEE